MPEFRLVADFKPTGDQPVAIEKLSEGLAKGLRHQTLLGATGTGKSLSAAEPVLVGRQDEYGRVRWSLEPIGRLVDDALLEGRRWQGERGTEVVFTRPNGPALVVATVDPSTHASVVRPVTALSRHATPAKMWRVTTKDGRRVEVTGDHNFVRLGADWRLNTVETRSLRLGDLLPLPAKLAEPDEPERRRDVIRDADTFRWYVQGPAVLGREVPHQARRVIERGERARLSDIGASGVAVLERFGETRLMARRGQSFVPSSIRLSDEWLKFIGLFVAEGHVADRYATITPGPELMALTDDLAKACGIKTFYRGPIERGIGSRSMTELLRAWCGQRAGEKHLPPFWAELDDRSLGQLLAGYFEGDGWVEGRGVAVCAATESERLACEISYALLRMGIVARLGRSWKRAAGTSHEGAYYWQVRVCGAGDLRRFAAGVGFLGGRKGGQLAAVLESVVGGNADCLPAAAGRLVRAARVLLGVRQRDISALTGITRSALSLIETEERSLREGTLRDLVRALEQLAADRTPGPGFDQVMASLLRLLSCRWSEVASVEEVEPSSPFVYDLSVEGAETFLAGFGGLVVHNTFTIAQVIEKHQKPTLVLAHNKTLAAQLYAEFREFFPDNAVEYFVSYFDYYQPEAYLPRSDTYIEKDSSRNDEIDKLRHAATKALFERRDVIIVASVSCIYGLGAPIDYGATILKLRVGGKYRRDAVLRHLVDLQYQRNDAALSRARFRVRGDTLELIPAAEDHLVRVEFFGDEVERITELDPLTGELLAERKDVNVYPATHYVTPADKLMAAVKAIDEEMELRVGELEAQGRVLEGARLRQRTTFDLEMMRELGYCTGIENYSRHLSAREAGSRPWTLLDYFPPDWLLVVDESHMSIPQVVGMYKNDRTRKEILVDFGFRLPSALDNRPLTFEEFEASVNQAVYMSATPGPYELERSQQVVQQLIRPTGVVDPHITVKPTEGQIDDLLELIRGRVERNERSIVTTLTKKMAEDLTDYMHELGVKVQYLHSEVDTLERVQILRDLRLGIYDVIVGINLLREGIDLPEVTLVAILDADKEGFLRSAWSLVQMIGRAARNVGGEVVMYADRMTDSMKAAIGETDRRRVVQEKYNRDHNIEPITIVKGIRDINDRLRAVAEAHGTYATAPGQERAFTEMAKGQIEKLVAQMEAEMRQAARSLEFERAAALRDEVQEIRLRVLDEDASVEIGRAAERAAKARPTGSVGPREAPARAGRTIKPVRQVARRVFESMYMGGNSTASLDVTEVRVVSASEEPGGEVAADTASDWLPGIRDEHEDDGWAANWLDRPTWDHTVTPNVIKRTGTRPRGRRR